MTHVEIENLVSDYVEGSLEPSVRLAVEDHLRGCEGCREMVASVRHAVELCRAAEDVEPKPWLVSRILLATAGQRKPTWRERIKAYLRPMLQPRVAYPVAMSVFTLSVMVNATGLNLKNLRFEDLDPRTWIERADREGHLMAARAEKFYYDLRVVYEIESRVRQMSGQPQLPEEPAKPAAPAGGSSSGAPLDQDLASREDWLASSAQAVPPEVQNGAAFTPTARSVNP